MRYMGAKNELRKTIRKLLTEINLFKKKKKKTF